VGCTILVLNHAGHNIIVGLFRGGVSSSAVCPSRGLPQASSSPLGNGHRLDTTQSNNFPILPLSTYTLVEQPPPKYTQRLDWVRGHHMPRLRHPSLTCSTVDTSGIIGRSRYIRVLACATQTCISRQTRATSSSGVSPTALCCKEACAYVTFLLRRSLWCRL
jgi:hypothetical protein